MHRVTNRPVWAVGVAMTMCCTATPALGRQATNPAERVAAARAELARQATMPDTFGTGKFPAIKEEVASPPDYGTGELPYYHIAGTFWDIATNGYMYATGGVAGVRTPNNAECFTAEPDSLWENGVASGGQNETYCT